MPLRPFRPLLALALLCLACGGLPPLQARTLYLGSISDEPNLEIERFKPLADYLASQLAAQDIDAVDILIAADIEGMARLMRDQRVDLYIDSPFPILAVLERSGGEVLLRRWKQGVATYRSLLFTRNDSGIDSIADLPGHSVAFEEAHSTSGHVVPRAGLLLAGLKLHPLPQRDAPIAADEVGYLFSGDDRNTLSWVWRGRVSAGALNDHRFAGLPQHYREGLKVIHRSIAIPRHLVSRRAGLGESLTEAIQSVLLEMEHTPAGRAALAAFEGTRRFDRLPDDDGLSGIRALARALDAEAKH